MHRSGCQRPLIVACLLAAAVTHASAAGAALSTDAVGSASSLPTGEQRTLVMLADFRDAAGSCSASAVDAVMFSDPNGLSVAALYAASSLGKVSITGRVVGPLVLDAASTDPCNFSGWADAADAAAAAAGVDVGSYPRRMYVMPPNSCPGAGLGTIGSAQGSRAWIFDCATKGVYAHEFGHNLGMDHAATPTQEYGDATDPMTVASWMLPGVNAPHRSALGWLDPQDAPVITSSGLYDVAPLTADPLTAAAPRTLVLPKPDTGDRYYLSYRTPLGADRYIDSSFHYRLSVHQYRADGTVARTYRLAGLGDGQSFSDAANGITVALVSHDDGRATVRVDFATPCVAAAPTVAISPQSQSAVSGNALSYALAITSHDGASCPSRVLTMSSASPSGWVAAFTSATIALAPGATGAVGVTVTSPSTAVAGAYSVGVTAGDPMTAAGSAAATYIVQQPPDSVAPTAPSALAAAVSAKRKEIALTWQASTDDRGVAGYRIQRNGVVVATSTGTQWVDTLWSAGATYVYGVVAFDAAGNASPPSATATVTLSGGTKKR